MKGAWYPGIIASPKDSVHGFIIHLPLHSITQILERLDKYEGDEYERRQVSVTLTSQKDSSSSSMMLHGATVSAYVYAWIAGNDRLDFECNWSLEAFIKKETFF